MSQIRGSIGVNVRFNDSTFISGAQSIKTITLQDSQEYATGKVVYYQGTAGTAQLSLGLLGLTTYRNSAGNLVTINGANRIVYTWDGGSATANRTLQVYEAEIAPSEELLRMKSYGNIPAMSYINNFVCVPVLAENIVTGVYTIVIYSEG